MGEGGGEGKVVGDGSGEMGEDCKVVVGKISVLWGVGGQKRICQHEVVKECGKEFIETPIPTNVGHNYGLAEISSISNGPIGNSHSPNKGQLESGGGDPTRVTMEEEDAPCKIPSKIEEVKVTC